MCRGGVPRPAAGESGEERMGDCRDIAALLVKGKGDFERSFCCSTQGMNSGGIVNALLQR